MSVIKKVYPLTPMQEGMLYHSLMEKDKSMYFVQMSFKTEGMFQFPLLERAWGKSYKDMMYFVRFLITPR